MSKITPFLWFNTDAEEAMNFYISVFGNGKIMRATHGPDGTFFGGAFEIHGQQFNVINGGPQFPFTEAISLFVDCETQEEVDALWEKLTEGGSESQCGWLKDKYGLSWQIIPRTLSTLLADPDPVKSQKVMQAMLSMKKINIVELEKAYNS